MNTDTAEGRTVNHSAASKTVLIPKIASAWAPVILGGVRRSRIGTPKPWYAKALAVLGVTFFGNEPRRVDLDRLVTPPRLPELVA